MSDWDDVFGSGTSAEGMVAGIKPPTPHETREKTKRDLEQDLLVERLLKKNETLNDPEARFIDDMTLSFDTAESALRWMSANLDVHFENRAQEGGGLIVWILPPLEPLPEMF